MKIYYAVLAYLWTGMAFAMLAEVHESSVPAWFKLLGTLLWPVMWIVGIISGAQ